MKKLFAVLLMLCMALYAAGAAAATVSYIERGWDGTKVTGTEKTADCTPLSDLIDKTAWSNGWYAVIGEVTVTNRITVTGDVHLILQDGATLTAKKGIDVSGNGKLTIYGQSEDSGRIVAKIVYNNQGEITGNGEEESAGIGSSGIAEGGTITIHGGTIEAAGYEGAGIGGGIGGAGGSITILGGTVTATSKKGAGIGGGMNGGGGTITIHGGTITAQGEGHLGNNNGGAYGGAYGGAGIGGGSGKGGTVTITGGHVLAESFCSAGIGGGYKAGPADLSGKGATVSITGGTVEAKGCTGFPAGYQKRAIGGGVAGVHQGTLRVSGDKVIMRASETSDPVGEVFEISDAGEYLTNQYAYAYIQVDSEEDPDDGNPGGGVPGEAAPPATPPAAEDLPQTGDPSMLSAWVCLLAASGAMGVKMRRKK